MKRRNRQVAPAIPRSPLARNWSAYWTTFVVLASYSTYQVTRYFLPYAARRRALHRRHVVNARRIERSIARLGGLYVKVGQLFSVLTNFLPTEFRRELEGLQDAVPPRPLRVIRKRIQEELGAPPEEVFAQFDSTPLASASLGQVHAATLHDGTLVAVKVQYPDVEELVTADLGALRRIARIVARYVESKNITAMYREVEVMVLAELDFQLEAEHLEQIRHNLRDTDGVRLPRVFAELSTARVLTLERMEGVKVTDILEGGSACAPAEVRGRVARLLIKAYCEQIFEHGIYHADPHPGNILVAPDHTVVLLDFGAVARLDDAMRSGLIELLQGVFTADTDRMLRALRSMGFVAQRGSDERLEQIVSVIHERLQSAIRLDTLALRDIQIDPKMVFDTLLDLKQLDVGLRELTEVFHVPSQWILLERTILMLTGVCTSLDSELQPVEVIRPYVERLVLARGEDWSQFAVETAKNLGVQLVTLPSELRKVLTQASRGRLELRAPALEAQVRALRVVGHQWMWAAFTIASVGLWTVCEVVGRDDLAERFVWASTIFGVVLIRSLVYHALRPGK